MSLHEIASGKDAGAPAPAGQNPALAAVVRKVGFRLMWFLMALYFVAIMDRVNIAFAALSMNKDLGLTAQMFGIAVGITYVTYSTFELPSNLMLAKFGARVTLTRIAILWGLATMAQAFAQGPLSFYAARILLGAAEAGLFPGTMLYLSFWFPSAYRARFNSMINFAAPVSFIVTSIASGAILGMNGVLGLAGWKWVFILEGVPAILLGVVGIFYLTNRPVDAAWLAPAERELLQTTLDRENDAMGAIRERKFSMVVRNPLIWLMAAINFGLYFGLNTASSWLPLMLRGAGVPVHAIGLLAAIPPVGGMLGMFFLSRRSDRKQERVRHTIAAMLITAFAFALIAMAHSPAAIIVGFVFANVGVFSTQALLWTIPQSYLTRDVAPAAMGLIGMVGSAGGGVIPIVIGHLKDSTHSFTPGLAVVSAAFFLTSLGVYVLGRKLGKAAPAKA